MGLAHGGSGTRAAHNWWDRHHAQVRWTLFTAPCGPEVDHGQRIPALLPRPKRRKGLRAAVLDDGLVDLSPAVRSKAVHDFPVHYDSQCTAPDLWQRGIRPVDPDHEHYRIDAAFDLPVALGD